MELLDASQNTEGKDEARAEQHFIRYRFLAFLGDGTCGTL